MTPQTDREWAKALAAVHPDVGGDPEAFIALQEKREKWLADQPTLCGWCGTPLPDLTGISSHKLKYCNRRCGNAATGAKRRGPRRLKD